MKSPKMFTSIHVRTVSLQLVSTDRRTSRQTDGRARRVMRSIINESRYYCTVKIPVAQKADFRSFDFVTDGPIGMMSERIHESRVCISAFSECYVINDFPAAEVMA